jgi:hypothetical protein
MPTVIEGIHNFIRARRATHNGPDLVDRILERPDAWEYQVNVAADDGEPVDGRRNTYTNGEYTWCPIRIPKHADSEPEFHDYQLQWPFDLHAEGIGWTGWDWRARRSRAWGFDFDALTTHAKGIGVSDEELERVKQAAMAFPLFEVRKSTGGSGIHLYTYADEDGISTENHTVHAALARCILGMASSATGFDFASQLDACGGVMWVWHRKMTKENEGLKLLKPAEKRLSLAGQAAVWLGARILQAREDQLAARRNVGAGSGDDAGWSGQATVEAREPPVPARVSGRPAVELGGDPIQP